MFRPVLHVYQRPHLGDSFFKRYIAYGYRHTLSALGGDDTASCRLAVRQNEGQHILSTYLGCRVAVYMDNPAESIWEGYVNRVSLGFGGLIYTRSLDDLQNRVSVIHSSTSDNSTQHLTVADNLSSQDVYGIKEGAVDGGQGSSFNMTPLRDAVLGESGYPASSVMVNNAGGDFTVSIEMKGYYHWFDWFKYVNLSGTAITWQAVLEDILGAFPNTDFMNTTDTSLIDGITSNNANPVTVSKSGVTGWEAITWFTDRGDGEYPYIAGVTRGDTAQDRKFYFRAANLERRYIVRKQDAVARDLNMRPVKPWRVRPDGKGFVSDLVLNTEVPDGDPREFYIEGVDYDAERGTVQLRSSDDITPEGAFRAKQRRQRMGVRFGVQRRRVVAS